MKRCAFLVHLRTIEDITIAFNLPRFFIPILGPPLRYIFKRLGGRLGFTVRSKFKIGKDTEGYILLIWLTGEQMMSVDGAHRTRNRILETVFYAQDKLKCDVIGLGGLIASVTMGGKWLTDQPEIKAAITHGDSYSVCVAAEGVQEAAKRTGLDISEATVAIVGATGIIGRGLVTLLAPIIKNGLILIGRNSRKLEEVKLEAEELGSNPTISLDIEDIGEADIIVTATSWPEAVIGSNHLKKGAIVYEVSQPRNANSLILHERSDVLIIDGSYVRVPRNIKFWWMGRPSFTTFACMAETVMQTLEGDSENHTNKISLDFVEEVRRRAGKYGFSHAPFTSFNKAITANSLRKIARMREKGK